MIGFTKLDKEFFATQPDISNHFRAGKMPVQCPEATFCIESLLSLNTLLTKIRLQKEKPTLRFLMDTSGVAWFGREHSFGLDLAPKHFQMTGKTLNDAYCVTAGNLKFRNSKCKVLKNINHRSGDFRPSFYSLQAFLALLIVNEPILPFKLPRVLIVKELDANGNSKRKHRWSVSLIRKWVKNRCPDEIITLITHQNKPQKIVYYPLISTDPTVK